MKPNLKFHIGISKSSEVRLDLLARTARAPRHPATY